MLLKHQIFLLMIMIPLSIFCQELEAFISYKEEMPRFPGCEDETLSDSDKRECSSKKLIEYVYKNLEYPEEAKTKKIEGLVVVQFYIEINGSMSDIKLVRDIGSGCGDAALDVIYCLSENMSNHTMVTNDVKTNTANSIIINQTQQWRPGYQRGKAVRVLYTLPFRFRLPEEDDFSKTTK